TGGFSNIKNFVGGGGSDTITGRDLVTTFDVTGTNSGSITDTSGAFMFSSFENLTGGSDDDTFHLATGGSLTGSIDGGDGSNTLSYFGRPSSLTAVTVNLQTSTATDIGGTFAGIGDFVGGSGSDTIVGRDLVTTFDV